MKNIGYLFLLFTIGSLLSCSGRRMDDPQTMALLQEQLDSILRDGYRIERIDIYGKTFGEHGPSGPGRFNLMYIRAVPPDPAIGYLAHFSYSAGSNKLTFHGYPPEERNKRKGEVCEDRPDLPQALSRLEEMKRVIPDQYRYVNLLRLRYEKGEYELDLELKPLSTGASDPKVKTEEQSYVKHTVTRTRPKFGTTQEKHHTRVKRKTQHSITVRLDGDRIEIP